MTNDDQAQASPDAQVHEGGEGSSLQENPSSGDPFDGMTHEQLLAEAKKQRAIMQRNKDKPAPKADPAPTPASAPTDVFTKTDLYRINNDKARKMLKADPEMSQFEDKIIEIYANRRGQDTPEDIFEDLKDALAVVKARTPAKEDNPAAELQTTSYVKPSSPRPQTTEQRKSIISKSQPISDWYKKKE